MVIDVGPEFRIQALEAGIKRLDGVLLTHTHADHCHGLDDVRIFSHTRPDLTKNGEAINSADAVAQSQNYPLETAGPGLPVYANAGSVSDLMLRFRYVFHHENYGGGLPKLNLIDCTEFDMGNPVRIGSLEMFPIPMLHGSLETAGWLVRPLGSKNSAAYLTDCSFIPESSLKILEKCNSGGFKIEHLVIDGLRKQRHSTHCSFDEALSYADRIGAERTWLTHIAHDNSHEEIQKYIGSVLPNFPNLSRIVGEGGSVSPAFDGLELFC